MQIEYIGRNLPALFASLMVAVLFIQSGLDKVFDWKGNLEWLTGHFAKTPLAKMVPMMLVTITVVELTAGILAAAGIAYFLFTGSLVVIFAGAAAACAAIAALFFGQRVAKDYAGAAVLVPYFLLAVFLLYLTNPFAR